MLVDPPFSKLNLNTHLASYKARFCMQYLFYCRFITDILRCDKVFAH